MKRSILILLGLAAAWAHAATGEADPTYFHPAASRYIHGDASGASNLVARGLARYPDDGKLKRLKELLEQQQEQNNQGNQQDQQEQQEQPPKQDNHQDPEQNQQDSDPAQDAPPPAEQMTEDEAKQLLDAMRQEEQNKRLQLHPVMGAPVKVDKDW